MAFDPAEYGHIAHGYAVTIHKNQGATVDRTYVLADALMNRNASYVALTRHREGVRSQPIVVASQAHPGKRNRGSQVFQGLR